MSQSAPPIGRLITRLVPVVLAAGSVALSAFLFVAFGFSPRLALVGGALIATALVLAVPAVRRTATGLLVVAGRHDHDSGVSSR